MKKIVNYNITLLLLSIILTEWVVIEGDLGHSVHLDGVEYPVPTQFSPKDKWSTGVFPVESRRILNQI